jgi:endonuclease/exonuclease/phosphatase family metal-dependent hydrolase
LVGQVLFACHTTQNYLDPESPRFYGSFAKEGRRFADTLKVVSFNIKFSQEIDLAIRELSAAEPTRDADILLLQEMDEQGVERIAKALAYNYVYYPAGLHPHHNKNFGNAVLAKWPIANDKKILLPYEAPGTNTSRIAVAATVVIGELKILTYSVHTATIWQGEESRLKQANRVIESIPEQIDYVIVGGDFNTLMAESLMATEDSFYRKGLVRATKSVGRTVSRSPLKIALDHIFVKGMQVVEAGAFDASRASDHLPIWVKLKIDTQ